MNKKIFLLLGLLLTTFAVGASLAHAIVVTTPPTKPPTGGGSGGSGGGGTACTMTVTGYPTSTSGVVGKSYTMTATCATTCTSKATTLSVKSALSSLASFSVSPASSTATTTKFTATVNLLVAGASTLSFTCSNASSSATNSTAVPIKVLGTISSCSVGVSETNIAVGDAVTWYVTSTVAGGKIYFNGTYAGKTLPTDLQSEVTNAPIDATYSCAELGAHTLSAKIVGTNPAQGSCTTNTVSYNVSDPNGICNPIPTACTDVKGFASQCGSVTNPATNVVQFLQPGATASAVSFNFSVKPPSGASATSTAVWNQAYYWAVSANQWIGFPLNGTPYPGTTCPTPSKGCWLEGSGSQPGAVVQISAAKGDAIYFISYDKTFSGGAWHGPTCSSGTGTCWRLSVYPPNTASFMIKLASLTNLQDINSLAGTSGYLVKAAFKAGQSVLQIENPITHAILVTIGEQDN